MGMNYDFSANFRLFSNARPVTLRAAGAVDLTIPSAKKEPVDWKDPDLAGGNVLEGDVLWYWPSYSTPVKPPLGSRLIDQAGVQWTILGVTTKDIVHRTEAHCRNLSVVYNLNNLANVLKATWTKSPGGEALPTWNQVFTSIPARFQPIETEAQILEDSEWPKTTFHVFLGQDIFSPNIPVEPASADYRLVDTSGRKYRIVSYQRAERIDALPYAVCVLIIEGAEGNAVDRLGSSSGT